jgi:hypothetical protein
MRARATSAWPALAAAPAAHEGHGRADWHGSVLHYLLEPEHAVPAAILLVGAIAAASWLLRRARRGTTPAS